MIKKISYQMFFATMSLLLWMVLFVLQFIKPQQANNISYFAAKIEFIIHVITIFFILKIYAKTALVNKSILFLLMVSTIGIFINDLIFYNIIYFPNNYIGKVSSLHFSIIMLPFFIWAIAIMIFFYKLLIFTFELKDLYKILFVFISLNATIIFLIFTSIPYAINLSFFQKIIQSIGYITESIIFDLAILCLIYSKNKGLSWIASGYAVLIAGDFLLTYTHLTQTDNTLGLHGELFWFLGLLFMVFGIFELSDRNYKIKNWIKKEHSIKHIFAFWTFRVSFLSILPIFILAYFFLPINKEVFLLLPSVLIMYSIILVIFSLLMGRHFETPFKQIESNIDALILKKDKKRITDNFSIEEFIFLQKFIVEAFEIKEQKEKTQQIMLNLTTQVAHDIRSPIVAINTALSNLKSIPEKKRIMIRNAAKRINDIANNLLLESKNYFFECRDSFKNSKDSPELIFFVLDNIVSEKQYELNQRDITINLTASENTYTCFSNIHLESFKRILSNLINNSIEAINFKGEIVISLTFNVTHVEISIEDNGCGIPPHILPKITEQGFSFNKNNGAGLGLSHAKKYLDQINGKFHIKSEEKIGTKITISLPRSDFPSWFCNSLNIQNDCVIVVLDDDPTIHDAWTERFATISNVKLLHSFNVYELLLHKIDPYLPTLYLVDYELLADIKNGLDVIEELKLNNKAILVTSCFEDIAVRTRCENIGVRIIPKAYVPYIQIILIPESNYLPSNVVFIDDDEMMRTAWIFAAEDAGKSISTYSSFEEFINKLDNYSKSTIIYIDSDLGDNIKGEVCAKYLFDKGFSEIHLTTAYSKDQFGQMPWIKTVVGKEPPFISTPGG